MIGYKLFSLKKDGSIGPLFINKRQRVKIGEWVDAECHPTKGFAVRSGWHVCSEKNAPHLSKKGRVWCRVKIVDYTSHTTCPTRRTMVYCESNEGVGYYT